MIRPTETDLTDDERELVQSAQPDDARDRPRPRRPRGTRRGQWTDVDADAERIMAEHERTDKPGIIAGVLANRS